MTEFAVARNSYKDEIVQFVEEFLPLLEHSDFIYRYSWWYPRYYEKHDNWTNPWFWLDSYNSLLEEDEPILTDVGKAYDHPWHLDIYKPAK